MIKAKEDGFSLSDPVEIAAMISRVIKPSPEQIRKHAEQPEKPVGNTYWKLAKDREQIFFDKTWAKPQSGRLLPL
jgi:hypothetical protein